MCIRKLFTKPATTLGLVEIASALNKIIHNSHFQKRITLKELATHFVKGGTLQNAIFASSTSKFGIEKPLVDDEDFKSSTQSSTPIL